MLVCEEFDHDAPTAPAAYLELRLDGIRRTEWAGELAREITDAVRAGWRAVDRPDGRHFAGPCSPDCDGRLWHSADAATVRCPACGATYDVADRREWLLAAARDHEDTADRIASAISLWTGRRLTASTIRVWVHRGHLQAVDRLEDRLERAVYGGRAVARYRLGDVHDVLTRRDLPAVLPEQRRAIEDQPLPTTTNGGRS